VLLPYLVLVAVAAAAAGIGWVVYGTKVFVAETLQVAGSLSVSRADITAAAQVPSDVPLAKLDTEAIARRVEGLPPIADARVTRSWPRSVTITVRERSAVAVLKRGGSLSLVDAEGVAFRPVSKRPAELPEIAVQGASANDPATRAALAVAQALPADLRGSLTRISAATAEQVTLELESGRTVFWGGSDDNTRKATVAKALLKRPGRRIDVSDPEIVTVR
jgi:cell division protein FtsQ